MASKTRQIIGLVLFAATMSAAAAVAVAAQDPVKDEPVAVYSVAHDHAIGKSKGELRITKSGIEFRGEGKDETRHSRNWRDDDIKRLEIKHNELRVVVYEATRTPLIPRKAPFTDGKTIRSGTEHDYVFKLRKGEITPEIVSMLLARFNRPVATSVIPNDEETGKLLFEIPVFHRHRAGGRSGVLRVYEQHIVFAAEDTDDARFWCYTDIRDIGNLGRYRFEIATYEGQFGVDGKSYIFDLKRPMTEAEYETLWTKVYAQGRQTGLRPALKDQ
ncbi:MAG: hypothetical protein AB7U82_14190 [Blastocatellales bacterium]